MKSLKIRNKNAILELLRGGVHFDKITVAENLDQDSLTKDILSEAVRKNIKVEKAPRKEIDTRRTGESHEVLVGFLSPLKDWALNDLLDNLYQINREPFFLLLNKVSFENNIGIMARTAFATGVNGLIFQGDEDRFINEETLHFSLGAIARIPLVKMGIFEALGELQKNGVKTFAVEMSGTSYFKENLTGPVAFILGDEGEGLSEQILSRCDRKISIPMQKGIDSLNVGVSAGVILYEKVRQESTE